MWEARWNQPSRGNPLFEDVPLQWHFADLLPLSDVEWDAERDRAHDLNAQGINPFKDIVLPQTE